MVKIKISVMLVALMVTFAIPTMAFADESATNPDCEGSISNVAGTVESPAAEEPAAEQPAAETPVVEPPAAETPVAETPVVEPPAAETPVAETPAAEQPAAETPVAEQPAAETPIAEPPAAETPVVEQPAVVPPMVEQPVVELPVVEIPQEECTLIIHHLFQQGDVVCDDYETIDKLTAGDKVTFEQYSYEDEYEFVTCLNGSDSLELQAGTNNVTIMYTLKDGFKVVE